MTMAAPSPIPMRERLRTDYHWTPRQKEVLELIARGRTNTQIAEELGISLDGAKWHVSEILSKLQAESRAEAGDYWRRYNGFAPRFGRVFQGFLGGAALKLAAGATAAIVAGGTIGAFVVIALNQAAGEPTPGSPETPVTNPGLPADPGTAPTLFSGALSYAQPVEGIAGNTLYIVTGCTQCDGPDETLQKHVTDASGATTVSTLLRSNTGPLAGWTIGEITAAPDASLLGVVVCDAEYCGGLGTPGTPNWRVLISKDGGANWVEALRHTGSYLHVPSMTSSGFTAVLSSVANNTTTITAVRYRDGRTEPLTAPPGADQFAWPFVLRDGSVLWVSGDRTALLYDDGTPFPLSRSGQLAYHALSELADGTLVVAWAKVTSNGYYSEIVDLVDRNGTVKATLDGNAAHLLRGSGNRLIGNVAGSWLGGNDGAVNYPVVIDLATGTATPIVSDLLTDQRGRNRLIAFGS